MARTLARLGQRWTAGWPRRAVVMVVLAAVATSGHPLSAAGDDPAPGSAAWYARDADNLHYATSRTRDQLAHEGYRTDTATNGAAYVCESTGVGVPCETLAVAPLGGRSLDADRYRADWHGARGRTLDFEVVNRYGVTLRGTEWAPLAANVDDDDLDSGLPVVVVLNAWGGGQIPYEWLAQGLAEEGYLVVTFDPQTQGRSGRTPSEEYCDPAGEWRQPQEGGLVERGECAGTPPLSIETEVSGRLGALTGHYDWAAITEGYMDLAPNLVFGTIDVLDWLFSPENPWHHLADSRRIGLAGHSVGAWAAVFLGGIDERIDTVVSFDFYAYMPESFQPRVPTMIQASEQAKNEGPRRLPPADDRPARDVAISHGDAGIDTMLVYLRGSSHQEWSYGLWLPVPAQTRYGERVGYYFTLAWFEAYLRHPGPDHQRSRAVRDAERRLSAATFDDSADRTSIGLGTWDATTGSNVPYRIAGRAIAGELSFYFNSFASTARFDCDDLRLGC